MFAAFLEAEDDTLRALSALRNGTSRHPGVVPGQTRLRKLAQVDSLRIDIHALARCFGRIKGVLVASKMFVDDFGATASSFVLAPILLHYMPKMSAVMTRMLDAWQRAMAWTRVEDFVLFWTFFALGAGAQETTLMSQVSLHEPATPSRPPRFARHSVDSAPASHPSAIDTRTGMADDDDLALGDVVVMSPSLHSVEAYLLLPLVRLVNAHRQICRIAALTTTSHPDARVLGLNATILASLAGRALSLIERHQFFAAVAARLQDRRRRGAAVIDDVTLDGDKIKGFLSWQHLVLYDSFLEVIRATSHSASTLDIDLVATDSAKLADLSRVSIHPRARLVLYSMGMVRGIELVFPSDAARDAWISSLERAVAGVPGRFSRLTFNVVPDSDDDSDDGIAIVAARSTSSLSASPDDLAGSPPDRGGSGVGPMVARATEAQAALPALVFASSLPEIGVSPASPAPGNSSASLTSSLAATVRQLSPIRHMPRTTSIDSLPERFAQLSLESPSQPSRSASRPARPVSVPSSPATNAPPSPVRPIRRRSPNPAGAKPPSPTSPISPKSPPRKTKPAPGWSPSIELRRALVTGATPPRSRSASPMRESQMPPRPETTVTPTTPDAPATVSSPQTKLPTPPPHETGSVDVRGRSSSPPSASSPTSSCTGSPSRAASVDRAEPAEPDHESPQLSRAASTEALSTLGTRDSPRASRANSAEPPGSSPANPVVLRPEQEAAGAPDVLTLPQGQADNAREPRAVSASPLSISPGVQASLASPVSDDEADDTFGRATSAEASTPLPDDQAVATEHRDASPVADVADVIDVARPRDCVRTGQAGVAVATGVERGHGPGSPARLAVAALDVATEPVAAPQADTGQHRVCGWRAPVHAPPHRVCGVIAKLVGDWFTGLT
ncbi:uncharacterized protein AMSG_02482 [Thecamonas trahens ATCC 50062]|uniref:Uncharacterized protein n=1 Tax=Thecamonas trahens ATCC 50062 TaxID=461836 RepID=A0A0L0D5H4_THETB|nr:hypothetical protein AMSG_02482 [Thecamonas trahens ATCC 50062]KNC47465.1 hypothetical protein AMSG_02482 [Thecamonas trahens ATCC 50062]|eukprot:XP_013759401.1 hypothetical protein AMSG_02482 [Thecamonas trahens ATCC 50062]